MSFIELKSLIFAQIAVDLIIVFVFILLIRRFRHLNKGQSFYQAVKIFESLLADADKMSGRFKEQLEEKNSLIKEINEQLDKKIKRLNTLIGRADALLSIPGRDIKAHKSPVSLNSQEEEIIKLAKEGRPLEEIAHILSIPKEEVKLILSLQKKDVSLDHRKGVS